MTSHPTRRAFLGSVALGVGSALLQTGCATDAAAARDLRQVVGGRVLRPGDGEYDVAARPWNMSVAQQPAAVVELADSADAAAVVRYARDTAMTVTVQPNGHGASGNADSNTILVRTNRLNQIHIDPHLRTARIGAGTAWGELLGALQRHDLLATAGSTPAVNVIGYTLGGGLSWFSRKYGWTADHVLAIDIIDHDGTPHRITRNSDADLFWALRGGGGDFALVTAIELELTPAPTLYGGRLVWSINQARPVLDAYRLVTSRAPDELTVWYQLLQFPGRPPMVAIDATHLGAPDQAGQLLRPFDQIAGRISDTRRVLALDQLGSITAEPTKPSSTRSHAELLTHLDDGDTEILIEPPEPLFNVQLRHLGGALATRTDSATEPPTEEYLLTLSAVADAGPRTEDRIRRYRDALHPQLSGRVPFTFLSPGDSTTRAFSTDTLTKLREIKRRNDPRNIFRSNFPVGI
ncbi:FAD-binding oxidoreductase [Nocardia amamiensis]|uniref:FAD-binding oxidoreductase n=1 Tax=Nocardia amamiensis TaxID=404578 RepID=UPI000A7DBF9A|nr:FAD-binding oxidoreductase [Nocardia amamiensis]